jgi:hypothetical protein
MIDPETELDSMERSDLARLYNDTKGWAVVTKILRIIVEDARVAVDNAVKDEDVLRTQKESRAIGIVVTRFMQRVDNEVAACFEVKKMTPQEGAPGLDMDDLSAAVDHLPNLLGETYFVEDDAEESR